MDVYQMITDKIISELNNGIIPWQKPWNGVAMAVSHTNGRPYSLLNQMLLENKAGEWLTFKQITDAGGSINKGEKAHFVVFWKYLPKKEKNEKGEDVIVGQFPILKYYNVWHISQCTGIEEKYPTETKFQNEPIENCEEVIEMYSMRENLEIKRNAICERAYYKPSLDYIEVPNINQFPIIEQYYSTLFHEMTHSTGAENRLNRKGVVEFDHFGSEQYSKEELIAEMGAAFLCNLVGLDTEKSFKNSTAYIQSWLKALRNDKKLIVSAASKAEQATKFILTGEKPAQD